MLKQSFNLDIILLLLLIVLLILSIINPIFLLGAIGIGIYKIFGNKAFIPFSILLLLLIGLHGDLYMIGIILALIFIVFNIIRDIYRYYT